MGKGPRLRDGKMGSAIAVHVRPEHVRNEIKAILKDGSVQIALACPADDWAVNESLSEFLSELLDVPGKAIQIIAGEIGDKKLVAIEGIGAQETNERIRKATEK